eukprot:Pgem_evm1s17273
MDGTPVHRDHLFHALGDLYTQKKMWKKARECYEEECLAKMHFNRFDFNISILICQCIVWY